MVAKWIPDFEYQFTALRKTHNQGVFDVYSPDMLRCRKSGVLTGLPDGYGRGRIIGDYRRVALVTAFATWSANVSCSLPTCSRPLSAARRWRPPCACAKSWPNSGARCCRCRRWRPATAAISLTRRALPGEAVQWLYFAYLAAVKSQNGGAMSLGRTATFLDIYIERDLRAGLLNEEQAQGAH